MRVLLVNVFFAPQSIGGATRVVEDNVAAYLAAGVVEPAVFCTVEGAAKGARPACWRWRGAPVYGVPARGGQDMLAVPPPGPVQDRFEAILAHVEPDLVHFHCVQRIGLGAVCAVREAGLPYVITMHDGWWVSDEQFLLDEAGERSLYDLGGGRLPARPAACREALAGAAALTTVSEAFAELVRSARPPVPVRVVENGVTPLDRTREALRDGDPRPVVGYLAGIASYKGFHRLRAALEAGGLPDIRLLVVDHALPTGVEVEEAWGETRVTRTGFVPQAEVSSLYARLDALIVPSLWPESYGLVAREAVSAGCWVLASNRGAVASDLTEGVDGLVFEPSVAGITEALATVQADPGRYLRPPPPRVFRTPADQAAEFTAVYEAVLTGR